MLGGKFRHIETDVSIFVAEQEISQSLCEFRLAYAGRSRQKQDAARPATTPSSANSRHRALDDIERTSNGFCLSLDSRANERLPAEDFLAVDFGPRVVGDANFILPHSV